MVCMSSLLRLPRLVRNRGVFYRFSSTLTSNQEKEISFADHRTAYAHLSRAEILRAWIVLKLCSLDFLLQNSLKVLETSKRVFGRGLLEKILRPTLYDQFVAGDDPQSLKETANKLKQLGIKLMILPSLEEDIGQKSDQNRYNDNVEVTLKLAEIAYQHGGPLSCLQTKITALISADLLLKIAERNRDKEDQFCTISSWANYMLGGSFTPVSYLNKQENIELEMGLERLKSVGAFASGLQLRLLVDGEFTYLNQAISIAALSMAGAFNQTRPVVWNTYQCYLKDAFDKICGEFDVARRMGVGFGAKIVRGAYLERERLLSAEGNYPDPTNPSYEATSAVYDRVVQHMVEQVAALGGQRCNVIVASHNETSVLKALSKMGSLGILPTDNTVVFGQIYGMASNITVKLASEGYIVYNSVPYGSLFDVLPYLSRRATENRAVLKGTRRERTLLARELRARFLGF
ncbi:hydroxyproline dehydrogenase-like [Daphnia pulex]|uniref:hydroxyproline dehydrogenase-like n=1 Tax=Daphnia pulex TaxID=6669 RepID=UPI001EE0C33E|nr:hydroxyproline dehydrogenase-like [Daphnia pulex]XP_046463930.1 hydroxyproline dehydrogenase-like [Daphnia pulex]